MCLHPIPDGKRLPQNERNVMPRHSFLEFALSGKSLPQLVKVEKEHMLSQEQKTSLRVALELIAESGRLVSLCCEDTSIDDFLNGVDKDILTFEFFVFLGSVFVSRIRSSSYLGSSKLNDREILEAILGCVVLGGEIADSLVKDMRASNSITKRNFFVGLDRACVELISNIHFTKATARVYCDEDKGSIKMCSQATATLLGILNSYLALEGRSRMDKIQNIFLQMVGVGNIAPGYKNKTVTII